MLLNTALSADEIAKAKETIKDLNAAYKENSDASDVDLTADAEALTLGDLSSVTEDLVLPNRGMVDKDVKIQWTSSHPNIVSPTGKLTPLPDVDAHVVLMATLTKKFDSITKISVFMSPLRMSQGGNVHASSSAQTVKRTTRLRW